MYRVQSQCVDACVVLPAVPALDAFDLPLILPCALPPSGVLQRVCRPVSTLVSRWVESVTLWDNVRGTFRDGSFWSRYRC